MKFKLLVIRTDKPDKLANFYTTLGLEFEYHQHGQGPMHYSAELEGLVFEIYPLQKNEDSTRDQLRLGFEVNDLDELTRQLYREEVKIIKHPALTTWGYTALVEDIDGRKIELTQKGGKIPPSVKLFTPHYQLRFPEEKDIPYIFSATRFEGFTDGMLWEPPEREEELLKPLLEVRKAWGDSGYSFTIETREGLKFLGRISIRKTDQPQVWDVGFWTHPTHQNKGVMTEVLPRILYFGFRTLKAEKIEAYHATWNKASEKVLQNTGFLLEAYIEKGFEKNGKWVAENKVSIHRDNWIQREPEKKHHPSV